MAVSMEPAESQLAVPAPVRWPERAACDLLRALANPRVCAGAEPVAHAAEAISDWDAACDLAREHGMLPALYPGTAAIGSGPQAVPKLPQAVEHRLEREYQGNVFHSVANAAEMIRILAAFGAQGIDAMPFKGVILAAAVYGDFTARAAGDLDILVHRRDLERATALMLEAGYRLFTPVLDDGSPADPDHDEYHFEREADGMVVELRWRLQMSQHTIRRELGLDWAGARRQTIKVAGADMPAMNPETTLLVLAMHGCKHVWSRLMWIADIARLIETNPDLDWDCTLREARRHGLTRALALAVLVAHHVAAAKPPSKVLAQFERDRAMVRIARHIEETLFAAPGSPPPGRIPYHLQLLARGDRARILFSREILRPNERDLAAVKLPRPLRGLYPLVRVFRILRDRSAR